MGLAGLASYKYMFHKNSAPRCSRKRKQTRVIQRKKICANVWLSVQEYAKCITHPVMQHHLFVCGLRWLTVAVQLVVWEDVGFSAIIGVGCVKGKVVVYYRCLLSDFSNIFQRIARTCLGHVCKCNCDNDAWMIF